MSPLTLSWAIAGILHLFYTFSRAHRRLIRDTFILTFPGPSFTVLPRALRFWEGIFYLQAFFTLRPFPTFLPQPAFIKVSLRAGSFFLEVCRASCWFSKHRPSLSIYLIHSNPQPWYSEEFVFKSYQILLWITCGKKFSLSAPCSFRTLFACSKSYVKTIKKIRTRLVLLITASMKLGIKVILKKQPPGKQPSVIENDQSLMDKRCFWGLNIFLIQNGSASFRFVPPCRQLIL